MQGKIRGSWGLLCLVFVLLTPAGNAAAQEVNEATPITGDQSGITTLDESPGDPVEAADMGMVLSATPNLVVAGEDVTFGLDITGAGVIAYDTLEIRVILPAGWIVDETSFQFDCGLCYPETSVSSDGTGTIVAAWSTYYDGPTEADLSISFTATAPVDAAPGQSWDIAGLYYYNPEGDYTTADAERSTTVTVRSGTIAATVETIDDAPIPAGTTLCVEQTCQDIPEGTASGSVIQLPGLLPGTYAVSLAAPGYAGETANVGVEYEATSGVTLTLSALPGDARIVLSTSDGQPVPDSTTVCLDDRCELASTLAAAVDSGSTLTFEDVAPGTYDITVRDAAPYLDASGTVDIAPGGVGTAEMILIRAAATSTVAPSPTVAATATIVAPSPTVAPTQTPGDIVIPPQRPTPTPTATSISVDEAPAAPVTRLPSTGAGTGESPLPGFLAVMLGVVFLLAAVETSRVRRRSLR